MAEIAPLTATLTSMHDVDRLMARTGSILGRHTGTNHSARKAWVLRKHTVGYHHHIQEACLVGWCSAAREQAL